MYNEVMQNVIEIKNLNLFFRNEEQEFQALYDINLSFEKGKIHEDEFITHQLVFPEAKIAVYESNEQILKLACAFSPLKKLLQMETQRQDYMFR